MRIMVMLHCKGIRPKVPATLRGIIAEMIIEVASERAMKEFGQKVAALLKGGEVFELVGDVGVGKTTFTKGLAAAMGIDDDIQSPTFTISRVYDAND